MLEASDRSFSAIILKINEYMKKHNKNNIVELYKMIDHDGNSFIDKKVLNII